MVKIAALPRHQAKFGPQPFGRNRGQTRRALAKMKIEKAAAKPNVAAEKPDFEWQMPAVKARVFDWDRFNREMVKAFDLPRAAPQAKPREIEVQFGPGCACALCKADRGLAEQVRGELRAVDFGYGVAPRFIGPLKFEDARVPVYSFPQQMDEEEIEYLRLETKRLWWRDFLNEHGRRLGAGSSRAAYLVGGVVIKLPLSINDVEHNRTEAHRYAVYKSGTAIRGVPVAKAILVDEIVLFMETVKPGGGWGGGTPVERAAIEEVQSKKYPWLRYLDNNQAGLNALGELVAFDYSAWPGRSSNAYDLPTFKWGNLQNDPHC